MAGKRIWWVGVVALAAAGTARADDPDPDRDPQAHHTEIDRGYLDGVPVPALFVADAIGAAPTSSAGVSGVSIGGATSRETAFSFAGVDVTGVEAAGNGLDLPVDLVGAVYVDGRGRVAVEPLRGRDAVRGAVFSYVTPGALTGTQRTAGPAQSTIAGELRRRYDALVGAELGGPILPGALWLHAGVAVRAAEHEVDRVVRRRVDADADGVADTDADGELVLEEIERRAIPSGARAVPFTVRLDGAASPRHRGFVSVAGDTSRVDRIGVDGVASAVQAELRTSTRAAIASWTSQPAAGTRVHASVAWHVSHRRSGGLVDGADDVEQTEMVATDLGSVGPAVSPEVFAACDDRSADDPYPLIQNCPVDAFSLGGIGALADVSTSRRGGSVEASHRLHGLGLHEVSAGVRLERRDLDFARAFSGGRRSTVSFASVTTASYEAPDGTTVASRTDRVEGFAAHRWFPVPELRVDTGVRLGRETLLYAADLRDDRGDEALVLEHVSPELGAAYDWTREGRGLAYARWTRGAASVPLSVNDQGLAAISRVSERCAVATGDCVTTVFDGEPHGVGDGARPTRTDDLWAGVEYDVLAPFRVGLAVEQRSLASVLEDVGDGDSFALTNPDDARRRYRALIATARGRVTDELEVRATYTYSQLRGNYAGLVNPVTGQATPHMLSVFDRPELTPPPDQLLPLDRPHYLKLDGYQRWRLAANLTAITGARVRVVSGTPIGAYGSDFSYGRDEVQLLPPGALGRTPATAAMDLRVGVRSRVGASVGVELFADIFNLFDFGDVAAVDQTYTFDPVGALDGADAGDLLYAKRRSVATGLEESEIAARNPRFGQPTRFYAPRAVRLGLRVTF